MSEIHAGRLALIRDFLASKGLSAVILTSSDPHSSEYPSERWQQMNWASGFTGEAGTLVVTDSEAGLWTDSRYFIQAADQLQGSGIDLYKLAQPGTPSFEDFLLERGCVNVGVDSLCVSGDYVARLSARGLKVCSFTDFMDWIWEDRPSIPVSPIITLDEQSVGMSRKDKIAWLRDFLMDRNCQSMLLGCLDEIAWLLNVRGSDIAYNPYVISYLLVGMDKAYWFVTKGHETLDEDTLDSFSELSAEGVEILGYDDLLFFLSEHQEEIGKLFLDNSTLNYHIQDYLTRLDFSLESGSSPVQLKKAIKNQVEIESMSEAFFEDGLAVEQFLFWLENAIAIGETIDEKHAADVLESYRAKISGYRGGSFETISAYGPNAALPHYVTPSEGSALLQPRGLYLVDSGGQYLFGTTDITRTVPLGPCTDLEMEDYTLVLKGMIQLSMAVFPAGTAGCQIDALARAALWKRQRNYGHGTGHGIGFYLGVHEGPQSIRQNFLTQPLEAGMITSNEPGIYREGMHGVRHENVMLCVEAGQSEFGTWRTFETLTLCHIDTSAIAVELMTQEELDWLNNYNAEVYRVLSDSLPEEVAAWLKIKTAPCHSEGGVADRRPSDKPSAMELAPITEARSWEKDEVF